MSHASLPDTGQDDSDIVNAIHETAGEERHASAREPEKPSPGASASPRFNRQAAILIAILAASLALVDAAGKNAQNESTRDQISASDAYAFYQAKTIRSEQLRIGASLLEAQARGGAPDPVVEEWRRKAARLDSDPASKNGRDEILAKAKAFEETSAVALERHHRFENAAAALQIAIVLTSAAVVTGVRRLLIGSFALIAAGGIFAVWGLIG